MNSAIFLIIGLLIGLAIGAAGGLAISRANSKGATTALQDQIAAMQSNQKDSTRLTTELDAMKKSVETLANQALDADRRRSTAESDLKSQIKNMGDANKLLLDETTKIAGALSNTQTRGKFGEAQLELLLEMAGLREGIEFERQKSVAGSGSAGIPDVTIKMPGGSVLFIDSKFPFDRFLDAFNTEDMAERETLLQEHTDDLLKHVTALAKRDYHKHEASPDFVVLFAPFETILSEALRIDKRLLDKAFEKGVTIATPTTMMALLRTVGFVFSKNKIATNANEIQELAGKFLKNVSALHAKLVTVGERLKSTVKAYNEMVPTAETTVVNPAKQIMKISGIDPKSLKAIPEITDSVRELKSGGQTSLDDFIDVEEIEEGESDDN
jgi:DNA recombination protein RmuC